MVYDKRVKKIVCGHINIRSLTSNLVLLRDLFGNHDFDIFALSETWLTRGCLDSDIAIGGYNLVRNDRINRRGGAAKTFQLLIETIGLHQVVNNATRVSKSVQSLIDLVLVSNEESVLSTSVIDANISDHYLVTVEILSEHVKCAPSTRTFRDFKHFNHDVFYGDLQDVPWYYIYYFNDVNDKVEFMSRQIINLFNLHAPLKTKSFKKPCQPWLTDTIKTMIRLRDRALQDYKRTKVP